MSRQTADHVRCVHRAHAEPDSCTGGTRRARAVIGLSPRPRHSLAKPKTLRAERRLGSLVRAVAARGGPTG